MLFQRLSPLALALLALLCVALAAPIANAGILSVSGAGDIISPVNGGYLPNFFQDKTAIVHGWNEAQNVTLTQAVYVDAVNSGTYDSVSDLGKFNQYKIAAGTTVSSQYLYFDPKDTKSVSGVTFTFSGTILGIIVNSDRFYDKAHGFTDYYLNSDFLGNPLTPAANYPTAHFDDRGLELGNPHDSISISISGSSVTINDFQADSPGDQIRIITTATTPEPSTLLSGAIGVVFCGFFAVRRSRREKNSIIVPVV